MEEDHLRNIEVVPSVVSAPGSKTKTKKQQQNRTADIKPETSQGSGGCSASSNVKVTPEETRKSFRKKRTPGKGKNADKAPDPETTLPDKLKSLLGLFDAVDCAFCFLTRNRIPARVANVQSMVQQLFPGQFGASEAFLPQLKFLAEVAPLVLTLGESTAKPVELECEFGGMGPLNGEEERGEQVSRLEVFFTMKNGGGVGISHVKRRRGEVVKALLKKHAGSMAAADNDVREATNELVKAGAGAGAGAGVSVRVTEEENEAQDGTSTKVVHDKGIQKGFNKDGRGDGRKGKGDRQRKRKGKGKAEHLTGQALPFGRPLHHSPAYVAAGGVGGESEGMGEETQSGEGLDSGPEENVRFDPPHALDHLKSLPMYKGQVAHMETMPGWEGEFAKTSHKLYPAVVEALQVSKGVTRFFEHQAVAIDAALSGRHVSISTATSSGKSAVFNVAVLQAVLNPARAGAAAIYLFPTKALAQDQLRSIKDLVAASPVLQDQIRPMTLDGDTSFRERGQVIEEANIILTNPDMLHASVLPGHKRYSRILSNLAYVVVDEAHVYRGAFGAHVSMVLRRLLRLWAVHAQCGATPPQFICCSATMLNPRQHFAALLPLEDCLGGADQLFSVEKDTAPHGCRTFVLWNPPVIEDSLCSSLEPSPQTPGYSAGMTGGTHLSASSQNPKAGEVEGESAPSRTSVSHGEVSDGSSGDGDKACRKQNGVHRQNSKGGTHAAGGLAKGDEQYKAVGPGGGAGNKAGAGPRAVRGAEAGSKRRVMASQQTRGGAERKAVVGVGLGEGQNSVGSELTIAALTRWGVGPTDNYYNKEYRRLMGTDLPKPVSAGLHDKRSGLSRLGREAEVAVREREAGTGASGERLGAIHVAGAGVRVETQHLWGESGAYKKQGKPGKGLEKAGVGSSTREVSCGTQGSSASATAGGEETNGEDLGIEVHGGEEGVEGGSEAVVKRRSAIVETAQLLAALVKQHVRTIAFCRTRKLTELTLRYSLQDLGASAPHMKDLVQGYRGGYTKGDRRKIESKLFTNKLLGVVATSALELGVDIGKLDVTLHLGFPGSISSFRQQAGRAGRGGTDSMAIMVLFPDPVSQYFMRNPAGLLHKPPEAAVLDASNDLVIVAMLSPPQFSHPPPAPDRRFAVVDDLRGGEVIDHVEYSRAFFSLFEGAIYLHQARQYMVTKLDLQAIVAHVRPVKVSYYTASCNSVDVNVTKRLEMSDDNFAHTGFVDVVSTVRGYLKIRTNTGRTFERGQCSLPSLQYATRAFWVDIGMGLRQAVEDKRLDFKGGVHALAHALLAVIPLFLMCDKDDVDCEHERLHQQRPRPSRVLIFDKRPGGTGVSDAMFGCHRGVLSKALELLEGCPCQDGCLTCIHDHSCTGYNSLLDKQAALLILRRVIRLMIDAGRMMEVNKTKSSSPSSRVRAIGELPQGESGGTGQISLRQSSSNCCATSNSKESGADTGGGGFGDGFFYGAGGERTPFGATCPASPERPGSPAEEAKSTAQGSGARQGGAPLTSPRKRQRLQKLRLAKGMESAREKDIQVQRCWLPSVP
ncbi:unnamed protein product [Discosporangium mesarthrocarpum]